MSNYLITGSSRGLGLELVRQLAALPDQDVGVIIAVTRSAVAPGLQKLISTNPKRVVNVVIEDIADVGSVKDALPEIEQHLSGSALDVLVNNAGVMPLSEGGIETLSNTQFEEVFRTNVSSVQAVTSVLLPLLERGQTRKVVNISTGMGSIGLVKSYSFVPTHAYKVSKAALNMLTAQYAMDFEKRDFTFLAISPGWLQTDLGGEQADLHVSVGAGSVKDWIHKMTRSDSGRFVDIHVPGWEDVDGPNKYDGGDIPF